MIQINIIYFKIICKCIRFFIAHFTMNLSGEIVQPCKHLSNVSSHSIYIGLGLYKLITNELFMQAKARFVPQEVVTIMLWIC